MELVEADLPPFDDIIVSSGSALTHAGLLLGLRALGDTTPVYGVCVRRDAEAQSARVAKRTADVAALMGLDVQVPSADVRLFDGVLAPGYGQLNDAVLSAIKQTAQLEGLLLDPVYTGKAMAGALWHSRNAKKAWRDGGCCSGILAARQRCSPTQTNWSKDPSSRTLVPGP